MKLDAIMTRRGEEGGKGGGDSLLLCAAKEKPRLDLRSRLRNQKRIGIKNPLQALLFDSQGHALILFLPQVATDGCD